MPTHCPACRNSLPADAEICAACGAFFNEGFTGYLGRPLLLLMGRWSAVAAWAGQALAFAAGIVDPTEPELMIALQMFLGLPITLLMLVLALRLRHSRLGMMTIIFVVQPCLAALLIELTKPFTSRAEWVVIGESGAMLVIASLLVYRFWRRPVPPADLLACRNCGYLLRGLVVPRCPECGTEFDPKRLAGSSRADMT